MAIPVLFIAIALVVTVIACVVSRDARAVVLRALPVLVQRLLGRVGL